MRSFSEREHLQVHPRIIHCIVLLLTAVVVTGIIIGAVSCVLYIEEQGGGGGGGQKILFPLFFQLDLSRKGG